MADMHVQRRLLTCASDGLELVLRMTVTIYWHRSLNKIVYAMKCCEINCGINQIKLFLVRDDSCFIFQLTPFIAQ